MKCLCLLLELWTQKSFLKNIQHGNLNVSSRFQIFFTRTRYNLPAKKRNPRHLKQPEFDHVGI